MEHSFTQEELEGYSWLMRASAENPWNGFWAFIAIVALAVIVFNLGFARKLPVLKMAVIYILLVVGCFVLWFLEFLFGAPMIIVLIISALVLGAYRYRLYRHRQEEQKQG
ncbi:hypothetical protein AJ85_09160 [Alkalihalobacillus alcalophilus ATCC 27647 = CGMCC 1.3604]|uniref:YlaH-like protein n=1 Tax=Alkalihalobacillus alcalophilus ATCC 27647 = CGMCC 1.3604 TaxID=1218173 RepID=A0A094WM80_ALKAL|nr:YlaH-like family protein [Alkalihalobacillus alcalophilus]KGA98844.1 hypothetical protein BALCAV_0201850 [Alkalihalobacillus alcalophilus ATCC 27647 = CGMCC 1.3604]MED1564253.1 YlaH-like family protein [Alkalihalobacillus alcalophilus]THG90729.1 hypothetical protein AJ85_09160 [Alkalihalobacillus alcalophilus ATCC 27647 = CGMCC 1.3604]